MDRDVDGEVCNTSNSVDKKEHIPQAAGCNFGVEDTTEVLVSISFYMIFLCSGASVCMIAPLLFVVLVSD